MRVSALDDEWMKHTYIHELAHILDQSLGTNGSRFSSNQSWLDCITADGTAFPTLYCTVSPIEDFADSIAEYIYNPIAFETNFPNRANIIKEVLA
jgi:hypothetical protein